MVLLFDCDFQWEAHLALGCCGMLLSANSDHKARSQADMPCPVPQAWWTGGTLLRSSLWVQSAQLKLIVCILSTKIPQKMEQEDAGIIYGPLLPCPIQHSHFLNQRPQLHILHLKDKGHLPKTQRKLLNRYWFHRVSSKRTFSNKKLNEFLIHSSNPGW